MGHLPRSVWFAGAHKEPVHDRTSTGGADVRAVVGAALRRDPSRIGVLGATDTLLHRIANAAEQCWIGGDADHSVYDELNSDAEDDKSHDLRECVHAIRSDDAHDAF